MKIFLLGLLVGVPLGALGMLGWWRLAVAYETAHPQERPEETLQRVERYARAVH